MKDLMNLLSGVISVYMMLIVVRIVMTWFNTEYANDPRNFLARICDPYLNYFKKFNLRLGAIDFSPILGITALVIVKNILMQLATFGKITVGIILSVIITSIWYAVSSLLTFFILLVIIRLIMLLVRSNTFSPFVGGLDSILVPLASNTTALFVKNSATGYQTNLMILGGFLIALKVAGTYIIKFVIVYFPSLPF